MDEQLLNALAGREYEDQIQGQIKPKHANTPGELQLLLDALTGIARDTAGAGMGAGHWLKGQMFGDPMSASESLTKGRANTDWIDYERGPQGDASLQSLIEALSGTGRAIETGMPGLGSMLSSGAESAGEVIGGVNPDVLAGMEMGGSLLDFVPGGAALASVPLVGKVAKKASKGASILRKADVKPMEFTGKSNITAQNEFGQKLSEARQAMIATDRAQVDAFTPEGFSGKTYLTDDGTMGFTISDDGYLANLFRHPGSPKKGTIKAAMTKARAAGAKNLDAFDTYLVKNYLKTGAVETNRYAWDPSQATDELARALGGVQPDYVSMNIGGQIPEYKHSKIIGPREQAPLARRTTTPTGKAVKEPPTVAPMFSEPNIDRVVQLAREGMERGGDKWYWLGGLLDEFITELGPKLGVERFDKMMDYGAAVSPRSKVAQEIKRASVLYKRHVEGKSNTPLTPEMFPAGYGHMATRTAHAPAVGRIETTGRVGDPAVQPKISSYAENKKGNYRPMTMDTHNMKIISGQDRSPTGTEYPFMESRQADLAQQIGLDEAEWQSSLWVGGDEITGVADSTNMTPAFNQRLAMTAEILDITEEEAKIRWINGDIILKSMAAAVGIGLLGDSMQTQGGVQ